MPGLSLTFDRFRRDQAIQLINNDSATHQMTAILINDVPAYALTSMTDVTRFLPPSRQAAGRAKQRACWKKLADEGRLSKNRIRLGNTGSQGSVLRLKDAKGRTRMMLMVRRRQGRDPDAGRAG